MTETLDLNAAYEAPSVFPDIALRIEGFATRTVQPEPWLDCGDEDCDHDDALCWVQDDPEEVTDTSWVRAVMVGDDVERLIETTDLVLLGEDKFCQGCGQIGCSVDTRETTR